MFDYFIVIGLQSKSIDIGLQSLILGKQQPEILIVHPQEQQRAEFIENIKMWCFPDGIEYYTQDLKLINSEQKHRKQLDDIRQRDQLNHFVLTDEKGLQRYCSSLLYYEKVYVQNKNKHYSKLSKCFPKIQLKKLIRNPLILDEDTQLIYCPKSIILVSQTPLFDLQRQFLVFLYNAFIIDRGLNRIDLQQNDIQQFETLVLTRGLNGAEQEWNHVQVNNWKSDNYISIQDKDLLEFYISVLFTLDRNIEMNTEIRVSKFDVNDEILRFRTNDSEILAISNFTYRPMFSRLSLINIIKLVMCILQEKQILLFSSNLNEIPQITEALLTFIKPLKWSNIYIPCSHIDIWEYASALQPYIMGFDSKHKKFIQEQLTDKVFVDLDYDVVEDKSQDIYQIPDKWLIELKNKLNMIAASLKYSQQQKFYQWMEAILKTKKAFLNFMLQILQNVLPYLLNVRNNGKQLQQTLKYCFDLESYIKKHPEPQFIKQMANNTMLFSNFIEQVDDYYTFHKAADPPVISYVQLMKFETNKSYDFWKIINQCQDKDIEKNLFNFQQPHNFDLYPFLVKYHKFQELYNYKNNVRNTKSQKEINLHFYNDQNRVETRFILNRKENIFSKFDNKKVLNLTKIFTHQCVNSIILNYKLPMAPPLKHNDSYDYGPILQKRKSILRRQSTLLQDQFESQRDDNINIIVESMEKKK